MSRIVKLKNTVTKAELAEIGIDAELHDKELKVLHWDKYRGPYGLSAEIEVTDIYLGIRVENSYLIPNKWLE
jgi:hypothetical protein